MKISVIGVGRMGSGFAEGLLKAGYEVIAMTVSKRMHRI
jgi:3-hydroxyisobutyrate dehydrogenase-like beta-hydroxyacid dehydrogenase